MRIYSLFISVFFTSVAFSQTVKSIDEFIYRVDHMSFSESISMYDSLNRLQKPVLLTGYFSGDTLLKSIALFQESSRVRLTYYQEDRSVYVKEFDSITHELFSEVYGSHYSILRSTIRKPLDEEENDPGTLAEHSDYSTILGFARVESKAKKYHFKVKLTTALPLPPGCGIMAFGHLQKFEVISTDFPNYAFKYVLIIEPCPGFLGDHFFQDNKTYEVDVATNSGVTFSYSYFNAYEEENLPVFWSRKMVKVD